MCHYFFVNSGYCTELNEKIGTYCLVEAVIRASGRPFTTFVSTQTDQYIVLPSDAFMTT